MDELRDSSLLFSLQGLQETERQRVQREAREADERREAEIRRVAEAAARRSRLQREQREARERREALAREHQRFEHERLEALKQATVERARLEAEGNLRLVEAEQARQHDLALAQLREQQGAARYRALCWLSSSALALAVIGASAAYFGWLAPAHARQLQHLESQLRESAARSKAAELALAVAQTERRALSAELPREVESGPAKPAAHDASPKPAITPTHRPPPTPTRGACRDSGDPLDDCLR